MDLWLHLTTGSFIKRGCRWGRSNECNVFRASIRRGVELEVSALCEVWMTTSRHQTIRRDELWSVRLTFARRSHAAANEDGWHPGAEHNTGWGPSSLSLGVVWGMPFYLSRYCFPRSGNRALKTVSPSDASITGERNKPQAVCSRHFIRRRTLFWRYR